MSRDVQTCIEIVCNLPSEYKTGHKAPIDIVNESGYKALTKTVTVESIAKYLTKRQHLIDSWIQFSEDIRHTPAWGLGGSGDAWRVVYSDNGQLTKSFTFDNKIDACVKMIKEAIDAIGKPD